MTERLSARGVTRTFPGGAGVFAVDLTVGTGEVHALVGLNGAGKTTLMRLLLGMLRPDAGKVSLDGRELSELTPSDWSRVGQQVEEPLAYPELDVRSNLRIAARLRATPVSAIAAIVEGALADFGLQRFAAVKVRALSQGNRQRVGLAGVLQLAPDVIVLDEPTNSLDPAGVILLREAILQRSRSGAGVLVSSHHLDEVARIADRITVMNGGRIIGALDPHGVDIERSFFALVHADEEGAAR